ncbi:MAG: ATP-binding protein [Myxococcota bacterium]
MSEWVGPEGATDAVTVERVSSALGAAERLMLRRYDLAVWDLPAAEGRGVELLREIRARGDGTRFVLVSDGHARARIEPRLEMLGRARLAIRSYSSTPESREARSEEPRSLARNADRAPVMLWRTDAEGLFTHFNLRWCEFTGRSEDKERGLGWLDSVHREDAARWRRNFTQALESRREFQIDLRLRPEGGGLRWLRFHGRPRAAPDGSFAGFLGASFDVTDLKRSRTEAVVAGGEVSSAAIAGEPEGNLDRGLEEILYAACHDLDEPLRTLQHDIETLQGAHRARALASVLGIRTLLRDLLECAHISGEGEPLADCDLSDSLRWALENLRGLIEETGARVSFDALPVARADPTQIARVFQNLIGNALRFRRSFPVRIHVGVVQTPDEWRFWVQDNGQGVPADQHERIFDPFRRLAGGKPGGRGLGLTICRRILDRHGGRIWLESELGRGSTFFFALPR